MRGLEIQKTERTATHSKMSAPDYRICIAQSESDFEDVFRLNHEIFAEEIPQHQKQPDGRLIDAYHHRNTYFLVRSDEELLGMICATHYDGTRFSVEGKLKDSTIIDHLRGSAIEIRLLAVRPKARGTAVIITLLRSLVEYSLAQGFRIGLISAVEQQERLYRKMGFEAIGAPVQSGAARFIPMKVEFEKYLEFAKSYPAFSMPGTQGDAGHG
jgi:N-acyl-L-homoserine lactone synthetase